MPTPTYTALANITVSGTPSSITFGSIPATSYRDLVVVSVAAGSTALVPTVRFNGDTGSNYFFQAMWGTGSSAFATTQSSQTLLRVANNASANVNSFLQCKFEIMDYSATNKHKTVLSRADNAANATEAIAGRWANTAAITSIQISASSGTFSAGSTFALYGIVA